MLPSPALTFTIPSIHDDTTLLDCRIHHPTSLVPTSPTPSSPAHNPLPWRKHAAIVAHPYAALGGSYDDAVVETIAATLLRQGYVVGTFNFRGAGHSAGKTSWTGKAERGDYASFAGFVAYYVHFLDPFRRAEAAPQQQQSPAVSSEPTSPSTSATEEPVGGGVGVGVGVGAGTATLQPPPVLLLCGYSYGAMITQHLPPLAALLAPFATPPTASAAADIRLRAQHLAEKQNTILASARLAAASASSSASSRPAKSSLRVGGDEDLRRSQEHTSRRSFSLDAEEKIRKGVAELMRATKGGHHHHHHHLGGGHHHHRDKKVSKAEQNQVEEGNTENTHPVETQEPETLPAVAGLVMPRVAYLLVSPPVGWATHLMTMSVGGLFGKRAKAAAPPPPPPNKAKDADAATSGKGGSGTVAAATAERQKLVDNPTLAIYGDSDVFVAVKRFREWAAKMQAAAAAGPGSGSGSGSGSRFRAHEISTAGHFYVEQGTLQRLADAVRVFSGELVAPGEVQSDGGMVSSG